MARSSTLGTGAASSPKYGTSLASASSPQLDTIRISELPTLDRDTIHDLWRRLHRKPPPKGLGGDLLIRALAYRIQCERHGDLPRGSRQRLAAAARDAMRERARTGEDANEATGTPTRTLRPGTRLIREWQGEVHEVIALPDGFLWRETSHRSLSVIAKAITGTSWNGWVFFGIERKKPKARSKMAEPDLGSAQAAMPGKGSPISLLSTTASTPIETSPKIISEQAHD